KKEDWFALANDNADDNAGKTVAVDSGRVGASQFTLEAQRIGKFKLTLAAHMNGGSNPADIVVREIEVVPNGREQDFRAAVSWPVKPSGRRHGRHPAHALWLLRANLIRHVPQRAGARLHEAHQETDSRSTRQSRGIYCERVSAPADL